MNLLGHFFLDRDQTDPLFLLGTATPDLLSIYNPAHRIKASHLKKVDTTTLTPKELSLYHGLARHFQADAIFHSSAFFQEETHWIMEELKSELSDLAIPRKFFVGHILLELILDKVLIQDNPGLLRNFYHLFGRLAPFKDATKGTERLHGHSLPNYHHFLEKFQRNQYMAHYTDWDHLVYVLSRIMRRVGLEALDGLESEGFLNFMVEYEGRLEKRYRPFFEWFVAEAGPQGGIGA